MNGKILTKLICFCLIICLVLPVIPSFIFDLGVKAEAAVVKNNTTIYLKSGSKNFSQNGNKVTAVNEVITRGGTIYVPVATVKQALDTTPFAVLETKADASLVYHKAESIDGISCIPVVDGAELVKGSESATEHTGYFISLSNMNLVCISMNNKNVFANMTDAEQVDLMKRFVFDSLSSSITKVDVLDLSAISANTNNFDHPYLFADQDQFDYLNSVYKGTVQDETLKGYLDRLVATARNILKQHTYSDGVTFNPTSRLLADQKSINDMPYYTGSGDKRNGYDVGGRQNESSTHANNIVYLAYAYQVTREEAFASVALDFAYALCEWEHWGAGHFLNAADAAYSMALCFDWCYDIWGTLDSAKRNFIRDGLFTKGVMAGVYDTGSTSMGTKCPWIDPKVGFSTYQKRTNNWNAVCSNGMIVASLALLGETGDWTGLKYIAIDSSGKSTETSLNKYKKSVLSTVTVSDTVGKTYQSACAWLINNNLATLIQYGLGQYVPDGSYIESAAYWNYGTTTLFQTIGALDNTCGTSYGLEAAWGLDRTAYYSYNVQTADGTYWRYHDDNNSSIPTNMNGYFGSVIGDDNIVALRKYFIASGTCSPSFYDTLRYDASVTSFDSMPLDSYMEGIQGFTARDTWQKGSVFAAFMGGPNQVAHGQLDSGAFVYHNKGVAWFDDIGTDNYNVYQFGYGQNTNSLKYYPVSSEGNNVLMTPGLTYGQEFSSSATASITSHGSNTYGSYAVLDQNNIFKSVASSAKRGMLMTNNRQTVVIQDEVTFTNAQTAYWFAHVKDSISITLSNDGRSAYLTDGKTVIRASIVSGSSYRFTVMDCSYGNDENFVLGHTDKTGTYSTDKGGQPQNDYSGWQKLAIKCENVKILKLAVVIEEVIPGDDGAVNYEWVDMASWNGSTPTADGRRGDNTTLLDLDFDNIKIGDISAAGSSYSVSESTVNGSGALLIQSRNKTGEFDLSILPPSANVARGNIGDGILVFEMDAATTLGTPSNLTLSIWGTDIYPIFEKSLNSLAFASLSSNYTHMTVIIDEGTDTLTVFLGKTLVFKETLTTRSYQGLTMKLSATATTASSGNLILDNIRFRSFTEKYTLLDDIVKNGSGIENWVDVDKEIKDSASQTGKAVAKLKTSASATSSRTVYSFNDLQTQINSGSYSYVDILASNTAPITISSPVTVNTNGYSFYATSSTLICEEDGNLYTYKTGSVKVTFIVSDTVKYTKTFNSALAAAYTLSASNFTGIEEVKSVDENGYTVYRYYTKLMNKWANSKYGDALQGKDLVVTTKNNVFYVARTPYAGSYVTVSNGVVSAGGTPAEFFTTYMKGNYDRISVTNSFSYGSGDNTSISGATVSSNVNLYLNGNTVYYASGKTSAHMFTNSGKNFNIYGPGTIENGSTAANVIFMPYNGSSTRYYTTFHGVNVESTYVIADQRSGTLEFRDCTIHVSASNRKYFSLVNYSSGAYNSYSGDGQLGHLILNGGTINATHLASGENYILVAEDNVRLTLKGGIVINGTYGKPSIMLWNRNGIDLMSVELGEYYSDQELIGFYNDSLTDAQLNAITKYTAGVGLTSASADKPISSGNTIAHTGIPGLPYRVVSNTDLVTVKWKAGAKIVTEYWVAGAVPSASDAARANLSALTPSAGMKYAYDFSALDGGVMEKGMTYIFEAQEVRDITVSTSLTLNSALEINFIFPVTDGVRYKYFYSTENSFENLKYEIKEVDGVMCYVVKAAVSPDDAVRNVAVHAVYDDNGTVRTMTAVSSVLSYAEEILSGSYAVSTKLLVSSMLDYVSAASKYLGNSFEARCINELKSSHNTPLSDSILYADHKDTSALKGVIESVYLNLGENPAYVFRFAKDFSGDVTFMYVTTGAAGIVEKTVTVENGKVNGKDTYSLKMNIHDFSHDVRIVANGKTTLYGIGAYYAQAVGANDELYALLKALYAYSMVARNYK